MKRTRPCTGVGARFALAAVVVGLVTACTSTSSGGKGPSTTAPGSTSTTATPTSDPTSPFAEQALAAYRGFRQAQVAAEATADAHNVDLARYAGDKALADERSTLTLLSQSGIVMKGSPTLDPKVTNATTGDVPAVTITDCVDLRNWVPVYRATGKTAAAPNQLPRVLATAIAKPYNGSWRIMSITTDRTRSC